MPEYAKVRHGIVEKVIVASPEFFDTFRDTSPGTWIESSGDNPAHRGLRYNEVTKQFAQPEERPERKRKRARNEDGTFKSDDPSTPDVNEAWES